MRKHIKVGQVVRFASKANFIGTEGSASVAGYWTIWQTRKKVNGWSQPRPVHINRSDNDIQRYRGTLWNWEEQHGQDELQSVEPILCPNCGEMRLSTRSWDTLYFQLCWRCNMLEEKSS